MNKRSAKLPKQDFKLLAQDATDLAQLYVILFEEKYERKPHINALQIKNDLIEILRFESFDNVKSLLEYFFEHYNDHGWYYFATKYHELADMRDEREKDADRRKALIEETKRRVEEYRNR